MNNQTCTEEQRKALELVSLYNSGINTDEKTISSEELKQQETPFTGKYNEHIFSTEDYASELYEIYTGHKFISPKIDRGDIVSGEIISMNNHQVQLDIGTKFPVYLEFKKENDPEYIINNYNIGDTINRLYVYDVTRIGKAISTAHVSLSKMLTFDTGQDILDSIGTNTHFEAKVTEIVNDSGYFVDINGIQCFMPGSLAAPNKIINFEEKIGEVLNVVPVNTSGGDKSIVVSHKKYIQKIIPELIENLELVTKEYTGTVTGSAKFGVFVEFEDYLTGLIHKSELDDDHLKMHRNRNISPGDEIKFKIKEVAQNDRIILTQKNIQENPWYQFNKEAPAFVNATVNGIKDYGLFLEVEPEIVGLLHVSEMDQSPDNFELGDELTVVITKIDRQDQKIYFTQQFHMK